MGWQSKFVTNNIFNLQYICRVTPLVWIVFVLVLMTVHMYCPWWVLLSCVRCNAPSLLLNEFGPVHLYVHCQHWAEHVTSKLPVSYLMYVSLAGLNDISSGPSGNIHNWMLIKYHETWKAHISPRKTAIQLWLNNQANIQIENISNIYQDALFAADINATFATSFNGKKYHYELIYMKTRLRQ